MVIVGVLAAVYALNFTSCSDVFKIVGDLAQVAYGTQNFKAKLLRQLFSFHRRLMGYMSAFKHAKIRCEISRIDFVYSYTSLNSSWTVEDGELLLTVSYKEDMWELINSAETGEIWALLLKFLFCYWWCSCHWKNGSLHAVSLKN